MADNNSTSDNKQISEELEKWNNINNIVTLIYSTTNSMQYTLPMAINFQKLSIDDQKKIIDAIYNFNMELYSIYEMLSSGISDLKSGKMPENDLPPYVIPAWGDTPKENSIIYDIWDALRPLAMQMIEIYYPKENIEKIVAISVLNNADNLIKAIGDIIDVIKE